MLAAECAWTILRTEHARMREWLARVEEALETGDWRHDAADARALAALVERLQAFDEETHRPKGVVLVATLRGRSAEADELLQRLDSTRERCDSLLSQAKARLKAAAAGKAGAADEVEPLLQEHHRLMLAHLDEEDSLLHSQTAEHLTRDEWAAVASSISKAMGPAKA